MVSVTSPSFSLPFPYLNFLFLLQTANLATKKRIQKRGQVTPLMQGSRSRVSDNTHSAALRSGIHSITRDREERNSTMVERVGGEESLALHADHVLESGPDKENHVSSAFPVTSSSNPSRGERQDNPISSELGKSLSERVKHYLSSKMNQIVPDPVVTSELRELEILQAGGQFSEDKDSKVDG